MFDSFAFFMSSACWRREYLAGAQRPVSILNRGRNGLGWPCGLIVASVVGLKVLLTVRVDCDDAGVAAALGVEESGLGMGARYWVSTCILGARISFKRKFLTACRAIPAGEGEGMRKRGKQVAVRGSANYSFSHQKLWRVEVQINPADT